MTQKGKTTTGKTPQDQAAKDAAEATTSTQTGAATDAETTATGAASTNVTTANAATQTGGETQAQATTETKAQGDGQTKDAERKPAGPVFDQAVKFSIPEGDAAKIAEAQELWDRLACDELPAPLAVAVLDCAIQQGEKIAERLLDKIGNHLEKPVTAETVMAAITDFLAWRLRRYAFTANAASKMNGWASHILRLQLFIFGELEG